MNHVKTILLDFVLHDSWSVDKAHRKNMSLYVSKNACREDSVFRSLLSKIISPY